MAIQSEIYLAKNIKLDRDYNNVLNYTLQQMLSYVQANQTAHASNYSFIPEAPNTISVSFPYSTCLESTYIAFQNKNYSNRWFFGWIDDVRYVNNGTTEITYSVDAWSTYFRELNCSNKRFIIRQHATNDAIGYNTTPEGLELGEYVINGIDLDLDMQDLYYVILATKSLGGTSNTKATSLGGIWVPRLCLCNR